jgi:hypothetical protein
MQRPVAPAVLRKASVHVKYEIEQLTNAYTLVLNPEWWAAAGTPTFMAQAAHNALVESFAIHARGVGGFLYDVPRHDDMSASDWFAAGEWAALRTADPRPEIADARHRVNKEIAHLTYARVDQGSPLWPHRELVERLRTDLFRFVDNVDPRLVCPGFKGGAWQSLPWPSSHPGAIMRSDGSAARPVATAGFGL